jgi:hypothetical protein
MTQAVPMKILYIRIYYSIIKPVASVLSGSPVFFDLKTRPIPSPPSKYHLERGDSCNV